MIQNTLLLIALLLSVVRADTTYNVICSPGNGKAAAVVIDGKAHRLAPSPSSSILYTGTAPSSKDYHYAVVDSQGSIIEQESFSRSLQGDSSPNEFYNRTWNTKPVRQLPAVFPPHREHSELHPTDQIPTFHFTADQGEIDSMHKNVDKDITVLSNLAYIRLDGVQTFSGVKIKIGGRNARKYPKLSYNINIAGKGDSLYGYSRLKLRALGSTDPAYLREDLTYKTLVSLGVPTSEASFARVFLNGRPMGLYTVIEHFKPSWLRSEFGNGDKSYNHGVLYQGAKRTPLSDLAGHTANLDYYPNNDTAYEDGQYRIKEEPKGVPPVGFKPLIDFTKFIHDVSTGDAAAWDSQIDIEGFIRFMVHEFFTGLSDNFIINWNNYFLYQDPAKNGQFTYMNADVNRALGNSIYTMEHMLKGSFKSFVMDKKGVIEKDPSPIMVKLLNTPQFSDRFNELVRELNDKLFSLPVLEPTIDDTVALISEDVEWDQTLPQPGKLRMPGKRKPGDEVNMRNNDAAYDCWVVSRDGIPFEKAVNGPVTGHDSTIGVKEWIQKKHQNVADFIGRS
ncbi:coth protein-domain-containing protein [Fennellomyces sp. T-0311]|nr:coth protein-domain-containing protein [Fennellomyces sp. T-0311]